MAEFMEEASERHGIRLGGFPKSTQRVFGDILEDLSVSTLDRSPERTQAICTQVREVLKFLSDEFITYARAGIRGGNKKLAERLRDVAKDTDDRDVRGELKLLAGVAMGLSRNPRTKA